MGICDLPVISGVCETAGRAAASLVSAPFDWLAQAIRGRLWAGCSRLCGTPSTRHHPARHTSTGYLSVYNLLFGIAVFVILLFFCLQLFTSLTRVTPRRCPRTRQESAGIVCGDHPDWTSVGGGRLTVCRDRPSRWGEHRIHGRQEHDLGCVKDCD